MIFRVPAVFALLAGLVGSTAVAADSNFGKSAFATSTESTSSFDRERGVATATPVAKPVSTTQPTVSTLQATTPVAVENDVAVAPTASASVKPIKPTEEIAAPSKEMVYIKISKPDQQGSTTWEGSANTPAPATGQYVKTDDPNVDMVAIPADVLGVMVDTHGYAEVNSGQVIYAKPPVAGAADIENAKSTGAAIQYVEVPVGRAVE